MYMLQIINVKARVNDMAVVLSNKRFEHKRALSKKLRGSPLHESTALNKVMTR
jgi:hypothetical protein